MAFNVPTIVEIKDRIVADMESRMTGNVSLLGIALLRILAIILAGAFHIMYRYQRYKTGQVILNSETETSWLDKHAHMWGILRKAAVFATGNVKFTGDEDSIIPAGTLIENPNGFQYTTDSEITLTVPYSGKYSKDVDITAVLSGADSNYLKEDSEDLFLSLVSPISGVDNEIIVNGEIDGGLNQESDEALLDRIFLRVQKTPSGGSESDYIKWAREVADVNKAWVFPKHFGTGTVVVVIDSTSAPLAVTVQDYIDDRKPVTANDLISQYVFPITEAEIEMVIGINPPTPENERGIEDAINNLFNDEGSPGGIILLSHLRTAIGTSGVYNYIIVDILVDTISIGVDNIVLTNFKFPKLININYISI